MPSQPIKVWFLKPILKFVLDLLEKKFVHTSRVQGQSNRVTKSLEAKSCGAQV